MPHSTWKGYLKLSLVSVPVRAFGANVPGAKVHLNQLHDECHSRIRYQKVCPIHGEVSKEQIVSGYEYAKGQYVVIEPEEVAVLRGERERAINIEAVLPRETVDRLHCTERSYFLTPDGKAGEKPFVLLQHCLAAEGLEAVCRGVMFSREELLLLRPVENLLAVTALKYDAELAATDELSEFIHELPLKREEVTLTKTLLEAYRKDDFSLAQFKDQYVEDLATLIQAKVEGKEVVKPPATETPQVINLMDALKKSLASQKGNGKAAAARSAGPKIGRRKARRKSG